MDTVKGAQAFQILAAHLKETGEGGLRRELQQAIRDAARPVADEIKAIPHLQDYMPDRYADVLAGDLVVSTYARAGGTSPGVTINARAPTMGRGGRKVRQRDLGVLVHPIFGQGDRRSWRWVNREQGMKGIKPGFFTDPAERAAPRVRDAVLEAMRRTCDEITKRT